MPSAVASPVGKRPNSINHRSAPHAKKQKLAQPPASRPDDFADLVKRAAKIKPFVNHHEIKNPQRDSVNEAATAVVQGRASHGDVDTNPMVISSGDDDSDDVTSDDDEESDDEDQDQMEHHVEDKINEEGAAPAVNGHDTAEEQQMRQRTQAGSEDNQQKQQDSEDVEDVEDPENPENPSFGHQLLAQHPEKVHDTRVIDVDAALTPHTADLEALSSTITHPLPAPNASSLSTVLSQALRTNDVELLDSCLRTPIVETIYATVERLPSVLAGTLLQKLAERLHKKPGRAGMLMVWVQWSLVAHGAFLASQPQLVKQLTSLNKVLKDRASGLTPLLALKGRLDMLQAQLDLRRRNQARAVMNDEDEAVIYIEGQKDHESSDDDSESSDGEETGQMQNIYADADADADSPHAMHTTMEMDEEEEGDSEDLEDLLDLEAEETDDDMGDRVSDQMSDEVDDDDSSPEDDDEVETERRSTTARARPKARR